MKLPSIIKKKPSLKTDTEDNLIKGCAHWDRRAQNELYNLFSSKMFAVCYKYSSSREEAEDTFHEGFMKVFENIKNFRKEGSLEGWIRRIMVNTAIEKYRKNSRMMVVVRLDDHVNGYDKLNNSSAEDMISRIEAAELMKLIHQLPPQYKLVFNLYEFEGLKHKEISEKLGISVGASKSNLSRAKAILQKTITKGIEKEKEIAEAMS